jgi:hypothetical protein
MNGWNGQAGFADDIVQAGSRMRLGPSRIAHAAGFMRVGRLVTSVDVERTPAGDADATNRIPF